MIGTVAGQWIFTAVFAGLAGQSLWSTTSDRSSAATIHHLGGAVMAVGMAAMAWPQWLQWPVGPQVTIYVVLALASVAALRIERLSGDALSSTLGLHRLHHLVMLFAMSWMVVTMGGTSESTAPGGHQHSGLSMGAATAVCGVGLTAAMLILTVLILVRFATSESSPHGCGRGPTGSCTLMGAGMVAMLWVMVA